MRAWMFYSWAEDYNDEFELLKNQAYLIGSFTNPEAVKRILGQGVEVHKSTDEEFDKLSEALLGNPKPETGGRRRRRKPKVQD